LAAAAVNSNLEHGTSNRRQSMAAHSVQIVIQRDALANALYAGELTHRKESTYPTRATREAPPRGSVRPMLKANLAIPDLNLRNPLVASDDSIFVLTT
jgi:hypothetical protein